jgi:alpha/beta hydrolase family protein DUF900
MLSLTVKSSETRPSSQEASRGFSETKYRLSSAGMFPSSFPKPPCRPQGDCPPRAEDPSWPAGGRKELYDMLKRLHASRLVILTVCLGLLAHLGPLAADELPFFPVWIDGGAKLTAEATETLVQDFAQANPDPEHIVVWIHGFATTRADSTKEYTVLAERLNKTFDKVGVTRPAIVGIQWDSAAKLSIFTIIGQYDHITRRARETGRFGARRFLLALQERFPQAKISIMAHSMGCEVTLAALRPKVDFGKKDKENAFEPDAPLTLFAASLLGADLDYDIAAKSRLPLKSHGIHLLWLTQDSLFRRDDQDKVLSLRAIISGKALGAAFPLMTEEQYDSLLGRRAMVFDKRDIPRYHRFLLYYDQERIEHIVRGILVKAGASIEPPEELAEIDAVMEAPNEVEALVPFLDAPLFSGQVYAIWRLEHLLGAGSSNFANGALQRVATAIYHRPKVIHKLRKDSPSPSVQKGLWPTEEGLARAGAPQWATLAGYGWTMSFRGTVTNLDDSVISITTTFGDHRSFDITSETRVTPSLAGLRVGSKVELQGALKVATVIKVIPFHTWIKEGYGDIATPSQ